MPTFTFISAIIATSAKVLLERSQTGETPYSLTAVPSLILMAVLVTVLVLALAYNVRTYKPPEIINHDGDTHVESPAEHE